MTPEGADDDRKYYTRDDIARMLGVSRKTVQRWDLEGKIPGRARLSYKTVRYHRGLIDAWIEKLHRKR